MPPPPCIALYCIIKNECHYKIFIIITLSHSTCDPSGQTEVHKYTTHHTLDEVEVLGHHVMEVISDEHSAHKQLWRQTHWRHVTPINLLCVCVRVRECECVCTLMKSFFLEPYSSNRPRGAAAGTNKMDLKVTSPSAVKWMWPRGSSESFKHTHTHD